MVTLRNASAFDTDPVVQSYVHALKRTAMFPRSSTFQFRAGWFLWFGIFQETDFLSLELLNWRGWSPTCRQLGPLKNFDPFPGDVAWSALTIFPQVQPSADPSKQGHVPAPRAKADEAWQPRWGHHGDLEFCGNKRWYEVLILCGAHLHIPSSVYLWPNLCHLGSSWIIMDWSWGWPSSEVRLSKKTWKSRVSK